jgi:plastocyanin
MSPRQGTVAALASIALLAGCGGGDSGSSAPPRTAEPPRSATVDIKDFKYGPPEVRVASGGSVTFVNRDRADHTATTGEDAAGEFDTGRLATGDSGPVRLAAPGRYAYVCTFHPYMKGTVVVGNGNGNGSK